jgi:hypothetical protein
MFALLSMLFLVSLWLAGGTVSAASQNFDTLDKNMQSGMLVSLTANTGVVEQATDKNAASLLGVITPEDNSLTRQAGQVTVQTDGEASALVSTLNGNILVGDPITASSIAGVGAKAKKSSWIVGVAQSSFDKKTKGALAATVTDSKGGKHTVYTGRISILVKATYYSLPDAQHKTDSLLPEGLQSTIDQIAGKHVSIVTIMVIFVILIAGIALAGLVINSAIRGGFAAVARQPLTKRIIFRGVLQSFAIAIMILGATFLAVFILLKLL